MGTPLVNHVPLLPPALFVIQLGFTALISSPSRGETELLPFFYSVLVPK